MQGKSRATRFKHSPLQKDTFKKSPLHPSNVAVVLRKLLDEPECHKEHDDDERHKHPGVVLVLYGGSEIIATVKDYGTEKGYDSAPMNTPKQAWPGTAVTARTKAVPKPYMST